MINPEQLRQIADVMERSPDGWWREFVYYMGMGEFVEFESVEQLWNAIRDGIEAHHKPKRISIHGWVDAEVIIWAQEITAGQPNNSREYIVAEALLDCVEKNDE